MADLLGRSGGRRGRGRAYGRGRGRDRQQPQNIQEQNRYIMLSRLKDYDGDITVDRDILRAQLQTLKDQSTPMDKSFYNILLNIKYTPIVRDYIIEFIQKYPHVNSDELLDIYVDKYIKNNKEVLLIMQSSIIDMFTQRKSREEILGFITTNPHIDKTLKVILRILVKDMYRNLTKGQLKELIRIYDQDNRDKDFNEIYLNFARENDITPEERVLPIDEYAYSRLLSLDDPDVDTSPILPPGLETGLVPIEQEESPVIESEEDEGLDIEPEDDEERGRIPIETEIVQPTISAIDYLSREPDYIPKSNWNVYVKQGCSYSERAVELLKRHRGNYDTIIVKQVQDIDDIPKKIPNDWSTAPVIFRDGNFIGGYDELENIFPLLPSTTRQGVEIYEDVKFDTEGVPQFSTANVIDIKQPTYTKQDKPVIDAYCFNMYVTAPWIKKPPGSELNVYITTTDKKFIIENNYIEFNDTYFYRPTKSFYETICTSKNMGQNKNLLTVTDNKGKQHDFGVLYEIKKRDNNIEYILQDEDIFEKYKAYKAQRFSSFQTELDNILTLKVDESIRELGKKIILDTLPVRDKDFIDKLEQAIYDKSGGSRQTVVQYLEKMADILVYMDGWNKSIFKERVENYYYLPSVLVKLTMEEKLPEIFANPEISNTDKVKASEFIKKYQQQFVTHKTRLIYNNKNPGKRYNIPILPQQILNIPTSKNPRCDVQKFLGKQYVRDIVYYTHTDGRILCFSINDLLPNFKNRDYTYNIDGNKGTFNDEFINRVMNFENKYIPDYEDIEEEITQEDVIILPGFIDTIMEDLETLENQYIQDVKDNTTTTESAIEKICEYCTKAIPQDGKMFKSTIKSPTSGEYKIVTYCNQNCLSKIKEDNDDVENNSSEDDDSSSEDDGSSVNEDVEDSVHMEKIRENIKDIPINTDNFVKNDDDDTSSSDDSTTTGDSQKSTIIEATVVESDDD